MTGRENVRSHEATEALRLDGSLVPAALAVAAWRQGLAPAFERRIEVW